MPHKNGSKREKPAKHKKEYGFRFFVILFAITLLIFCVIAAILLFIYFHKSNYAKLSSTQEEKVPYSVPLLNSYKNMNKLWLLSKPSTANQIAGYSSTDSLVQGSAITLYVSCSKHSDFTGTIFRMGWYGGLGARAIDNIPSTACFDQGGAKSDPETGLIDLAWQPSFKVNTAGTWPQGYYLIRLTDSQGYQTYIPFLVRSNQPQNKILFVHATTTDAAYNAWGGNSLYQGSTPALHLPRAVKVSLNRPYANNDGAGDFLNWEYYMVRFMERHDYKFDYATDMDINREPSLLLKYKEVVISGHDEYWTRQMQDGYTVAVKKGLALAIFAANTAYRPTRIENDKSGQADRVIVCYKNYKLDPEKGKPDATGYAWREFPFYRFESLITGELYEGETENSAPLVVSDQNSWIFSGTDVKNGYSIPGLVGYEYDTNYYSKMPHPKGSKEQFLFKSRVTDLITNKIRNSFSSYYNFDSGGQVFNAGTIQWSWGLDPQLKTYSPVLEKVTSNILSKFSDDTPTVNTTLMPNNDQIDIDISQTHISLLPKIIP